MLPDITHGICPWPVSRSPLQLDPTGFLQMGGKGAISLVIVDWWKWGHLHRWYFIFLLLIVATLWSSCSRRNKPHSWWQVIPVLVVLNLFIQKELPPQSLLHDSFRASVSFGENLCPFVDGTNLP